MAEMSTNLDLDREIYSSSDTLKARLTIRNSTGDPGDPGLLSFSSGQTYDLEIRDEQGQAVYQWSRGKTFPQIVSDLEIQDQKEYVIFAPFSKLPRGHYVAQAWFTADGPPRAFSASARFQIR